MRERSRRSGHRRGCSTRCALGSRVTAAPRPPTTGRARTPVAAAGKRWRDSRVATGRRQAWSATCTAAGRLRAPPRAPGYERASAEAPTAACRLLRRRGWGSPPLPVPEALIFLIGGPWPPHRRRPRSETVPPSPATVIAVTASVRRREQTLFLAVEAIRVAAFAALPGMRGCFCPRLACESAGQVNLQRARRNRPGHRLGLGERVQLSAGAGELRGRRGSVCRREEPSSYEAGLRAHGSNHRFHRLLGHAVARALTTAPRLTGLGPAAPRILILQRWRRKRRPGRCRV